MRSPRAPARNDEGVRVAVQDGHQRRRVRAREQLVDDVAARAPAVAAAALLEGPEHQVGAGQADHAGGDARARQSVGGRDDLGHDRADADQRDLVVGGGVGA